MFTGAQVTLHCSAKGVECFEFGFNLGESGRQQGVHPVALSFPSLSVKPEHIRDIVESQSDGLALSNEAQPAERVGAIQAKPTRASRRRFKQPPALVVAERVWRQTAPGRQLSDP